MKNSQTFYHCFLFSLYIIKKKSTLSARSFLSLWMLGNNVTPRSVARPETELRLKPEIQYPQILGEQSDHQM